MDQCRRHAGIPRANRPAKSLAMYYMVYKYHYDGDLVHSEITY